MGNNSVPKFIFRSSRFPVYRGSVLGRFYCTNVSLMYELKKELERHLRVNLLGPGPRLIRKIIYRAAVSQRLTNTVLYNGYRFSFLGVKRPGRSVDQLPLTRAEVKERVELHLYSPSGP